MQDHKTFLARMEHLEGMIAWVREQLQNSLFKENDQRKIELAMEEALVNIIIHGYPQHSRKAALEIIVHLHHGHKIEFKIIDKGLPFNPLLQSVKFNSYANIDERQEGGLGIHFMRCCMDNVHYERRHPFNILTLIKEVHT